jgi:hypothetical protein
MTLTADWPTDSPISPYRIVPWKQALAELDLSSDTLMRLLAENGLSAVVMTARKRGVLAADLFKLVKSKSKPAKNYAAAKVAHG